MQFLRYWYGRQPQVTLVEEAVGHAVGYQPLWISERTPTVTTLSKTWIDTVQAVPSFASVQWRQDGVVKVTTLDELITRYGEPRFCKIDVEGYELEVLRGLSRPLAALSFEYIPAAPVPAVGCIDRLHQIGAYEFNWSVGEQHQWQAPQWVNGKTALAFVKQLPPHARSGDMYARQKR